MINTPDNHEELAHIFLVGWNGEKRGPGPAGVATATEIKVTVLWSALHASSFEFAVLSQSSVLYGVSEVVASLFTAIVPWDLLLGR